MLRLKGATGELAKHIDKAVPYLKCLYQQKWLDYYTLNEKNRFRHPIVNNFRKLTVKKMLTIEIF